jgi:hypothetical protein
MDALDRAQADVGGGELLTRSTFTLGWTCRDHVPAVHRTLAMKMIFQAMP